MSLRDLLDLLRPTAPRYPAGSDDREADLPSIYLPEPPAPDPDPDPDDQWCTWPNEVNPDLLQAMDDAEAPHHAVWQRIDNPQAP
ncbi:hypothetical protein [Streptomyces sp. TLI_171]|uniref:hypothetical protein n=1 Tax=Streptomyces sp. TLI_171 TaxID=1938859 RepID=UPI000C17C7AE|nr:hypothetical protein [Streptomyces sp. TLI_171]RKE02932.1 hypothetical protein BX266_7535 [Streptomyces sp. TLI_171]